MSALSRLSSNEVSWLSGHPGQDFNKVTENFRLSYGLGLALKLGGIARLELNYCVPVRVRMIVHDNLQIMSGDCNFNAEMSQIDEFI